MRRPLYFEVFSTVSKPDRLSNIRTVRYRADPKDSLAKCQLEARRLRATKKWHEFWANHNADYNAKLSILQSKHPVIPSSEMSEFYRSHLESTREQHRQFNSWWIKENFGLLYGQIKCWFDFLPKSKGYFDGHLL